MVKFDFPNNFILGTGSSAFQIEGSPYADGKGENIWDYMCRVNPERFSGGAKTEPASSFYKDYKKDIETMRELGIKSFRFSISWARIMPNGKGKINQAGIDFYNSVIDRLVENGIEPFVDLFHWDLPVALEAEGGFKNRKIVEYFLDYAKVCFEYFGDRVKYFSTFNEPGVFCFAPYADGSWYPYETSFKNAIAASHNVLLAHFAAVKLYKEMGLGGKIGAVIDIAATYPKDPGSKDVLGAQYQIERGGCWWLDPIFFGHYPEAILMDCPYYLENMPENFAEELKQAFVPCDIIGINYYFPFIIEYEENSPAKSSHAPSYYVQEGYKFNTYPAGLYDVMMFLKERYSNPEIYITENGSGVLDKGNFEEDVNDDYRIAYIREHLRMVSRSIKAGANVKGYFYWSNFDSLESRSGYDWRFGLVYVDFKTGKKEKKKSWYYYQKVIADNAVD